MISGQRGQALVIVLLLTTAVFIIGGAGLAFSSTARKNAVQEVHQKKAYYIAEAGVERALAKAKSDPDWVRGLSIKDDFDEDDSKEVLFSNVSYPVGSTNEGRIEEVRVIKTSENFLSNEVTVRVRSIGRYQQSRSSLIVDALIKYAYPEKLFRGVWAEEISGLPQGHGVDFDVDIYISDYDLDIPAGSTLIGDIFCRGKVNLENGNKSQDKTDEKGNSKFTSVTGNIYALGDVYIGDFSQLTGNIYIASDKEVTWGKDVEFSGDVIKMNPDDLAALIPDDSVFPDLLSDENLEWYRKNADFYEIPDDLNFEEGIYFIDGDLSLSGIYSGRATIVVNGKVTIGKQGKDKYLEKSQNDDCLTILAINEIEIKSHPNPKKEAYIQAFLYSKEKATVKNKTKLIGAIIAPFIDSSGCTIEIEYDEIAIDYYYSNEATSFLKITRWRS